MKVTYTYTCPNCGSRFTTDKGSLRIKTCDKCGYKWDKGGSK